MSDHACATVLTEKKNPYNNCPQPGCFFSLDFFSSLFLILPTFRVHPELHKHTKDGINIKPYMISKPWTSHQTWHLLHISQGCYLILRNSASCVSYQANGRTRYSVVLYTVILMSLPTVAPIGLSRTFGARQPSRIRFTSMIAPSESL